MWVSNYNIFCEFDFYGLWFSFGSQGFPVHQKKKRVLHKPVSFSRSYSMHSLRADIHFVPYFRSKKKKFYFEKRKHNNMFLRQMVCSYWLLTRYKYISFIWLRWLNFPIAFRLSWPGRVILSMVKLHKQVWMLYISFRRNIPTANEYHFRPSNLVLIPKIIIC